MVLSYIVSEYTGTCLGDWIHDSTHIFHIKYEDYGKACINYKNEINGHCKNTFFHSKKKGKRTKYNKKIVKIWNVEKWIL